MGVAYPLAPHEIYGDSSKYFIRQYYKRMLNFTTELHPKLKKCLDLMTLNSHIDQFEKWGEIVDKENNTLAPYFEVFYQNFNPSKYQVNVKVHTGQPQYWGIIYSLDQSHNCSQSKIEKYHTASYSVDVKNNLFYSVLKKSYQDILYLKTFSLTFIAKPIQTWTLQHQKELNQTTYRLAWKNENEFTIYYP